MPDITPRPRARRPALPLSDIARHVEDGPASTSTLPGGRAQLEAQPAVAVPGLRCPGSPIAPGSPSSSAVTAGAIRGIEDARDGSTAPAGQPTLVAPDPGVTNPAHRARTTDRDQPGGAVPRPARAQARPDGGGSGSWPRSESNSLPTSVWLTGQRPSRMQRRGRYIPESIYHPGKMLPTIAEHAIAAFTNAGEIVADNMCGIGTTLVEAMHAGRHAIGVEFEQKWADLAQENLRYAAANGALGTGKVWCGDGATLPQLMPPELVGQVALVITSPPYGASTHGRAFLGSGRVGRVVKAHHRYGDDPTNLAYTDHDELAAGFTNILRAAATILRPGGTVAITARPYRHHGELVDIPGMVLAAGRAAGLTPVERCIALLCGIRDGRIIARTSFFHLTNHRAATAAGAPPLHAPAHEDVIIFRLASR